MQKYPQTQTKAVTERWELGLNKLLSIREALNDGQPHG